ncbi:4-amino-4-deoxy-L-arabinose transferase-like glycosyltransferase [Kibdelosporangium banguiense]|uniref:4-amino-4-deoxy-L-arabinose transferase-like glycosyltransferase n=1 Tax=Kibdelosporangium banguiense TaxID=1365924 RepID=A0ABS4U2Q6_9PSEU|nr:glycosyltransferase family 39 protein [Kibdelosporangium banguiense]MBP2330945.1 4-amino-4-deoxy-L-arabinose transferase-like glycosyltransferase [Kibdelosporangium banguiense]
MTAATGQLTEVGQAESPPVRPESKRWPRYALIAILAVGTAMYGYVLWTGSWGNTYYTAAIKSMSLDFTNFLFGSFDPAGVVTVDKPPLTFWPQVVSTWIFGFSGWSVLLPQVIEGVATIFLLHRTVRMWAGENAALIAALVLALTPITVVTNRTNNTDTMLALTLVAAAYSFTRAMKTTEPKSRTKWLWLAAFLIGCGFLAKMLAAWVVVPAFFAAYLAGSKAHWRRKVLDLAGAAVVLLAGSLWWVAVVDLWPGEKPYIGGSTDGSALDLVLGYNGLGRVFGNAGPGGGSGAEMMIFGGPGGPGGPGGGPGGPGGGPGGANLAFGGESGVGRMFGASVGGQISWLLPLALIALVVAGVIGLRRFRGFAPADTAQRAGWTLWGTWLVVNAVVFSFQEGIFHPYYTTVMGPAIGAIIGAGGVWAIKMYREPKGLSWIMLPASVAVTAAWAWVIISRDTSWNGWLRYAVLAVAVVAILVLVLRKLRKTAIVLTLGAILLAPGVWSGAGAFASTGNAGIPMAGPSEGMGGGFIIRTPSGTSTTPPPGMTPPGGMRGGRDSGTLSADQQKILDYAKAHSAGAEITMAVEGGAQAASPYIIATDETVIGMGGFSGRDPAPSADQLSTWVREGKLKFVLSGGPGRGGMRGGQSSDRSTWVEENCKSVLTAGNETLYECTVH